eukprot:c11307_g1_i1 orf=195-950(+)
MGDLRLMIPTSCSSSGALLPPFSGGSHKGSERVVFSRDQQQPGPSRVGPEPCRSLRPSSHSQRVFQCRALLDDRRLPFSFRTGEDGPPFKEEEDLNIFDRLSLAWRVLFPKRKKLVTPAEIAKQRLKMILISDRCSVNDIAKRKIVNNIVGALANFVEIESQDSVRLNVSADPDLGTVYSVSVPIRRVRPEYQDNGDDVKDDELREIDVDSQTEGKFEFSTGDIEHLETGMASSQDEEVCSSSKGLQDVEG